MTESSHYTYLKLAIDENPHLGLQLESMKMEDYNINYVRKKAEYRDAGIKAGSLSYMTMECSFILKAKQNLARECKNKTT